MVFMGDSERAAELAKENKLDVGLHLNFTDRFTANHYASRLAIHHEKIIAFLRRNKYAQLLYNPFLRKEFAYSCKAQIDEFTGLYGTLPSHIDGHHHMHLCANMLLSKVIPRGIKMRRNFSFWPGEKGPLNRAYRAFVDRRLAGRYYIPDYLFDLSQCIEAKTLGRVTVLAKSSNVELMTHPVTHAEAEYLMSDEFRELLQPLDVGSYALV